MSSSCSYSSQTGSRRGGRRWPAPGARVPNTQASFPYMRRSSEPRKPLGPLSRPGARVRRAVRARGGELRAPELAERLCLRMGRWAQPGRGHCLGPYLLLRFPRMLEACLHLSKRPPPTAVRRTLKACQTVSSKAPGPPPTPPSPHLQARPPSWSLAPAQRAPKESHSREDAARPWAPHAGNQWLHSGNRSNCRNSTALIVCNESDTGRGAEMKELNHSRHGGCKGLLTTRAQCN